MGNLTLRAMMALLLVLAVLAGCAGPTATQTRIPRPGPAEPPVRPSPPPDRAEPEPEVQTMPLERGEVLRPQALPQPEPMPPTSTAAAEAPVDEPARPASDNPVVVSLLARADDLAASGQLDRAAASVERGLRIAPKDAALWQRLARIRLQQGRYGQAESMAKKAIALARGRPGMIADNWKIVAEARRARGDEAGARRALDKMLQYTTGFGR